MRQSKTQFNSRLDLPFILNEMRLTGRGLILDARREPLFYKHVREYWEGKLLIVHIHTTTSYSSSDTRAIYGALAPWADEADKRSHVTQTSYTSLMSSLLGHTLDFLYLDSTMYPFLHGDRKSVV